jgi:hypothetical protein
MQHREINHDLCTNNSEVIKTISAKRYREFGKLTALNVTLHHKMELQKQRKIASSGSGRRSARDCDSSLNRLVEGSDLDKAPLGAKAGKHYHNLQLWMVNYTTIFFRCLRAIMQKDHFA